MQKTTRFFLALLFSSCSLTGFAQQVADTLFNPIISNPVYSRGQGPIIIIDEAHDNFHTRSGRYLPFARVLEKDGYIVNGSSEIFTLEQLSKAKILVIANALHPSNHLNWNLPTPSAFTDAEIESVNTWVKNGGSLFLIADHMPFPGAAEKLAASFGFTFYNGFALKKSGKDIFTPGHGLMVSSITKGRNEKETVTSLQSFTGQAFKTPQGSQPVIVLNSDYKIKMPQTAWNFTKDTPEISGENLAQGAYMNYERGRIIVFGEAAMFTAQSYGKNKSGMNEKSASQNTQFLLNAIHWLDGVLKE